MNNVCENQGPDLVRCLACDLNKGPRGRSVSANGPPMCDWDCKGYRWDPQPHHLWPGEDCGICGPCKALSPVAFRSSDMWHLEDSRGWSFNVKMAPSGLTVEGEFQLEPGDDLDAFIAILTAYSREGVLPLEIP